MTSNTKPLGAQLSSETQKDIKGAMLLLDYWTYINLKAEYEAEIKRREKMLPEQIPMGPIIGRISELSRLRHIFEGREAEVEQLKEKHKDNRHQLHLVMAETFG
ncbi:MAG: hypothetical protein COU85_02030 [Candidatus Portnoybacteria bacterium CG10_big_fil_rev_8_21_14_0_10_44_7]|uniref:Uncharacterized protein n=1 Tax=Candidatus Portnoybacteria bacterium CG10_big_fil_rev_8_21_14_0_10_44_7 TaxID=1974816 RepID=A0A2M8KIK9_9BACT|nr:MAG: hypothetical protein COU85_02030 [Candidatus Portnoybacteria bacterium CG10_big_fil_rev_8_21_14_0_10_44_7]